MKINKKIVYLVPLVILLLCQTVHASSWKTTFHYSQFNTSTLTYKALDKVYENWEISINVQLEYNTTTQAVAKIRINSTDNSYLDVCFSLGNNVDVWYYPFAGTSHKLNVVNGFWESGKSLKLRLEDGYLKAVGTDTNEFLRDYVLGVFEVDMLGCYGSAYGFLSGFVTVEIVSISLRQQSTYEQIKVLLPYVFGFVCVVVLLGVISKFVR